MGGIHICKFVGLRPWDPLGMGPSRPDFSVSMLLHNAGHVRTLPRHGGLGYLDDALDGAAPEGIAYLLAVGKVLDLVDQGAHTESLVLGAAVCNYGKRVDLNRGHKMAMEHNRNALTMTSGRSQR